MKTVILAGGLGSRLSEETNIKPKPMVEIGGKPILWHIMKIYSTYGLKDFIICLGYKGYLIKEYFANYFMHKSDVSIDLENNSTTVLNSPNENWRITLIDTGFETITGGRLKRIKNYLDEKDFCFTYGDGLANININELIKFHNFKKKLATVTVVKQKSRFGIITTDKNDLVSEFKEKPQENNLYVNGGFFVLSPKVLNYIDNDFTSWEKEPLEKLTNENQLAAYYHSGFWHSMDTLRDRRYLNSLTSQEIFPWFQK